MRDVQKFYLLADLNLHSVLATLKARRPVFHSEADFQHALAWEIQQQDPSAGVRLEKRITGLGTRVHLNLLIQSASGEVAIELKYKTRAAKITHTGEQYELLNQSAQDIGRHDFIKGIGRLERYVQNHPAAKGYAVPLSNDRTYWSKTRKLDPVDSAFRLHEGRILEGNITWGIKASDGTKRNRTEPLALTGKYPMTWHDYSKCGEGHCNLFRYAVVHVPSDY